MLKKEMVQIDLLVTGLPQPSICEKSIICEVGESEAQKMSDACKHVEKRNAAWILGYILKPGSHPGTVKTAQGRRHQILKSGGVHLNFCSAS